MPLGLPVESLSISPPNGSGVLSLRPALASAAEFATATWPQILLKKTGWLRYLCRIDLGIGALEASPGPILFQVSTDLSVFPTLPSRASFEFRQWILHSTNRGYATTFRIPEGERGSQRDRERRPVHEGQ